MHYNYYIYLDQNGNPINLPLLKENLSQVLPNLDFNNLPSNLVPFEQLLLEPIGVYQVLVNPDEFFVKESDGVVRNRRNIRDMTAEEKAAKIAEAKAAKIEGTPDSWTFNETLCAFYPPVSYPEDLDTGKWWWNEDTTAWEESSKITDDSGNEIYDPRVIKPGD
tara:strand:+ start:1872 stop:2363 length:492 start_codon:yes stop_codon:yes gene_type:complete